MPQTCDNMSLFYVDLIQSDNRTSFVESLANVKFLICFCLLHRNITLKPELEVLLVLVALFVAQMSVLN